MADITEADIEKYLHDRVHELGGWHRRCKWIRRNSAPDDRIGLPKRAVYIAAVRRSFMTDACAFWVECKEPNYKITPRVRAQMREHERMRRCGERVLILSTFAEVDAALGIIR